MKQVIPRRCVLSRLRGARRKLPTFLRRARQLALVAVDSIQNWWTRARRGIGFPSGLLRDRTGSRSHQAKDLGKPPVIRPELQTLEPRFFPGQTPAALLGLLPGTGMALPDQFLLAASASTGATATPGAASFKADWAAADATPNPANASGAAAWPPAETGSGFRPPAAATDSATGAHPEPALTPAVPSASDPFADLLADLLQDPLGGNRPPHRRPPGASAAPERPPDNGGTAGGMVPRSTSADPWTPPPADPLDPGRGVPLSPPDQGNQGGGPLTSAAPPQPFLFEPNQGQTDRQV